MGWRKYTEIPKTWDGYPFQSPEDVPETHNVGEKVQNSQAFVFIITFRVGKNVKSIYH